MKKIITSLSLLILSLLIALGLYKYFKLSLTLPLLSLGLGVVLAQRFWGGRRVARLIAKNIGILFSMISICFSILNSPPIVNRFVKSNKSKIIIQQKGDLARPGSRLYKEDADGLGYIYKPGTKNLRSHKIAVKPKGEITEVYNVIYNIDGLGNRLTPNENQIQIDTNRGILFVGGSITFGEGLNDDETLSYYIQKSSARSAINTGMHGYGAHQALRILEDEELYRKRTEGNSINAIIYRFIPSHIRRTAGYSPWDNSGPCYEISQSGNIEYRGSFEECSKRNDPILSRLASSNGEPFTSSFFERLTFKGNYFKSFDYHKSEDIDRFLAVTRRMEEVAKGRGASFYIIFEDFDFYKFCGTKVPFSKELTELLKKQHENLILTSDVYSKDNCLKNKLFIENDGHPSKTANKILSDFLVNNNLID